MNFEFATAGRIVFGAGKRTEALSIARSFGTRGLLVTGAHSDRANWLQRGGLDLVIFPIKTEPSIENAAEGACVAREAKAQFVIAIGGGSVIDAGKAIAALATNRDPILEYLEVIGSARPITATPLPLIALPTTAGTGAEVTRNAVLSSSKHRLKVSLRSPKMLPPVAIVDPELTFDLPPVLTASTGMDALTQLIEPFLCNRVNPMTDAICREAIPRAANALPRAFASGLDREARTDMALASLCGGLALANAGLGAVHGLAAPIGGMFRTPHGAVCAAVLPHALEKNLRFFNSVRPIRPSCDALTNWAVC
jgi:alcohol dehydrogenase class IV